MEELESSRKEHLKIWLRNPHNLIFLGIFILAIIIRLYYYFLTLNQPLWWDESVYMAYAKQLAGLSLNFNPGSQLSLFSYVAAGLFKIGFSEPLIRFFIEFLPSILIVLLIYKICVMMFSDKRIALISSFLSAVSWILLFNSARLQIDIPSLFLGLLSVYVFWQGYEKKEKIFGKISQQWAIPLSVILFILTFGFRKGYFMFGLFFLIYMFSTRSIKELVKDKSNWIALFIFIISFFLFQNLLSSSESTVSQYYHPEIPFNFIPLGVFRAFFENIFNPLLSPLFYLAWLGIILIIYNLIFSLGFIRKEKTEARSDLFIFLMLLITLVYFLFIQKDTNMGEPRWYFPLILSSFICISKSVLTIANYVKKHNRIVSIAAIVLIISYGGYYELKHADFIIKAKIDTYKGVKDSALFLKSVSKETDIIVSKSPPQTAYYSERTVISPGSPETTLDNFLSEVQNNTNIKFLLISFWEPGHPEFMKKEYYSTDATGSSILSRWEIPFLDTSIDFTTGQQSIANEKKYKNIKFKLLDIMDRVFIYEIIHE